MGKDPVFRKSHTSDLKFLLKVYTNKCTKLDWFTYVFIINHKNNLQCCLYLRIIQNNIDNLNHLYHFYWMSFGFQLLGLFIYSNLADNILTWFFNSLS